MSAAAVKFYKPKWSWVIEPAIEGEHRYWLPLVECPTCGESRSAGGLAYPWVEAERLFDAKTLRRLRNERDVKDYTWEEFKAHSEILRRVIDAQYPIAPGVEFGSFVGRLCDNPEDFVMPELDLVLARRSVVEELNREGFAIKTYEIELRARKGTYDFVELWAPPVGLSAGVGFCPDCNRGSTKMSGTVVANSVPSGCHFFRLKNSPNFLVFSADLVAAIARHNFRGLEFEELPVE